MSSSIALDTLNQQGSLSASVGTTSAPPPASVVTNNAVSSSPARTTNGSPSNTPGLSPRSSLQRLRPTPTQQPQEPPQQQDKHTWWSKIVEERVFIVTIIGVLLSIVVMPLMWDQYFSGFWSNAEVFYSWCKDEQSAGHTLTSECRKLVDKPLPPPPGLNRVFPGISRRDNPPLANWPPTDEDRALYLAFIHSPVGNGLSLAIIGFFALMLNIEHGHTKWLHFVNVLLVFHATREVSWMFTFRNVSLMMDWVYWLRKVGAKGPSWASLIGLPVFFIIGYLADRSTTIELVLGTVSVFIADDYYSHKLVGLWFLISKL